MSRFVRSSKYRHVFGQNAKKEHCVENVKPTNSAWDTNLVAASGKYISLNWNASGGGAFAILPLPTPFAPIPHNVPYKLPDVIPLARGHTAPVLDTDWSPHDDSLVVSGGEDGKVLVWKVDSRSFEDWGADGWVPQDFDPVARIDGSARKIGQVLFHPTASHVVASASGDLTVKLWDLGSPEDAKAVLTGHGDTIQSLAFNPTGTLLATTSRDRKVRLFDARAGSEAVRMAEGHGGIKGARVTWMGERDIATTGFSKMSDRQVSVWETGGLTNKKTISIDQSAGVIMPFWSDNGILFLAGKGDGNVRYYEYESDSLFALAEYSSSQPQRGMCFLPRRALNVAECEIARVYKVAGTGIEPIAFVVPRKADSFQADIYPDAPSSEPSLTAGEFFNGKVPQLKLVSLENGAVSTAAPVSTPLPTRAYTAPAPEPAAAPAPSPVASRNQSLPSPAAISTPPVQITPPTPVPAQTQYAPSPVVSRQQSVGGGSSEVSVLQDENDRLNSELRDARAQIRNLELQVEGMKANARKAAEALLQG